MRRHGVSRGEGGFTLIELIIILVILGLLAAVAVPRYVDLQKQALRASAKATLDAGKAAVTLDFASKIVNSGSYTTPTWTLGDVTGGANETNIESFLQGTPNYPGTGSYCTSVAKTLNCFHWYITSVGSNTSPYSPPLLSATMGDGTNANDVNTF